MRTINQFENPIITSPDRNGILFCGGRSEAEPAAKKIQWRAGIAS